MHRTSSLLVVSSAFLFACSSTTETDPTSSAALKKAEPLAYGCAFEQTSSTRIDGFKIGSRKEHVCSTSVRCDELKPISDIYGYGGGSTYSVSTTNSDFVDFTGTCADPQPISCDDYRDGDACDECLAAKCCAATYLCDHDPNCQAIGDCIKGCGDDQRCTARCFSEGYYDAGKNLRAFGACLTGRCASACGR